MPTDLIREIRVAARVIWKSPGFATVVILTLALGIGANSAIFGVVNAVLLRPFPFHDPDRLAVAWEVMPPPGDGPMFLSPPNYLDVSEQNHSFERLSAFAPGPYLLATDDGTVRLDGARITSNIFETLGVGPVLGRPFRPEEDVTGRVAIVSDRLWRGPFGGDPAIVGRSVMIDGVAAEIVGVMPPGFNFPPPIDLEGNTIPRQNDIWVPFATNLRDISRSAHFVTVLGRLRPDASVTSATSDLQSIAANLGRMYPESNENWSARVVSMNDVVLGNLRPALLVLLAAVGVVLLIACVNVANLLLSRATGRQKEFAIRAALGAGQRRLLRQAVVESQIFALLGALAGLSLAWAGTRALVRAAPANVPRLGEVGIDLTVVGFTLGVAVLTGLVFGLVPALRALAPDLTQWLREGARTGGAGASQAGLRDALVVVEVALSLLLLVGAGLLFRSFLTLRGIDPGFRAGQGLTLRISLPRTYTESATRYATFREIEDRVRGLPGVEAAGFSMDMPLASDYQGTEMQIEGDPPSPAGSRLANFSYVTPGYFAAMGIPVRAGRALGDEDLPEAEPTIVINEAAGRLYFSGQDPIGRRIVFGVPRRIVGVVGDVRLESLSADALPAMYVPYYQSPNSRSLSLVLRTRTDALALVDEVRARVRAIDPGIPVHDVRPLEQIVRESLAAPRFSSMMLLAFSLAALLLAAVGIYGVISYSSAMRTREIGVRMALGARPIDALRLVIGHAMRLAGLGVALGIIAALVLTRYLRSLLFGVGATDPAVLAGTAVFLMVVAAAAGWLPAWRASRVDPLNALRYE